MSYDGIIMQRAIARFDQARQRREAELDQRRREVFARQPRLRDIDRTLRTTMSRIVAAAAKKGEDPLPALRVLRDENLSLQRERAALLEDMGYPADYLEDKPACSLCGDTGYTRSGVCACLKQYYAREQLAELSRLLPLGEARFDTFRFDLYDSAVWDSYGVSPRANMERNFDVCRDFARQFSRGSGSLLLSGGTGLGKTFLSACIAREVSDAGFSVVYDTAISVFSRYEDAKFRPDEVSDADVRRCESCDLLILDDHRLCPERPLSDRQRPYALRQVHHHQHQPGPRRAGPPLRRAHPLPHRGCLPDPALLRRGYPHKAVTAAPVPTGAGAFFYFPTVFVRFRQAFRRTIGKKRRRPP